MRSLFSYAGWTMRIRSFVALLLAGACGGPSDPGTDGGADAGRDAATVSCEGEDDGTPCGAGRVCLDGVCTQTRCGNSVVEGMEQCDDGNETAFDGCTACMFDCTDISMCDNDDVCDGAETCDTERHFCVAGIDAPDGTACASLPTGVCREGTCVPSGCGNGVLESGEDCDDMENGDDADGCTDACRFTCTTNLDCADGDVCDGEETCTVDHTCAEGTPLDCADADDCTEDLCHPVNGCDNPLIDDDMDGHAPTSIPGCGTDCDDDDPTRYQGAAELCDGIDQDCDGMPRSPTDPIWFPDCDGDMYAPLDAVGLAMQDCEEPAPLPDCEGWTARRPMAADPSSVDCNDGDAAVRPSVAEIPGDGVDQNCDMVEVCFEDDDDDGYRRPDGRVLASSDVDCSDAREALASDPATDCDDSSGSIYPSAPETPGDEIDQSCDMREICYADADNDTYRSSATVMSGDTDCADSGEARAVAGLDCDDGDSAIRPGASEITGDEVDQNCDGAETCFLDNDDDGYRTTGVLASSDVDCDDAREAVASDPNDCNDSDRLINPAAAESVGDGVDQNCDGAETCYVDGDRDGARTTSTVGSSDPDCGDPGEALGSASIDCNDAVSTTYPGAAELCNRVDDNCSSGGGTDTTEDSDEDMHAPINAACSGGLPRDDCRDGDATVHPGAAEVCNRVDDNCSSGGGTDTAEDADNDMHSPIGAACTGGFPRDDCRDMDSSTYPGASEPCNRVDNNCSSGGGVDANEDFDMDLHAPSGTTICSGGYPRDDCRDMNNTIYTGATELCDRLDNNCSQPGAGAGGPEPEICYGGMNLTYNADGVALADVDNDGDIDIISNSRYGGGSNIAVFRNNGAGSFAAPVVTGVSAEPVIIATGRFNNDAFPDLICAHWPSSGGSVGVYLGNGSGGFTAATGSPVSLSAVARGMAIGDVNNDGYDDVALALATVDQTTVYLGSSSGALTLAMGSPFASGDNPNSLAFGLFDTGSNRDLVIAAILDRNMFVRLGNGAGGFTNATGSPYTFSVFLTTVAVGDVTGDGRADIVGPWWDSALGTGAVAVRANTMSGTFAAPVNHAITASDTRWDSELADMDLDGDLDYAASNNANLVIVRNDAGSFVQHSTMGGCVNTNPSSLAMADLDADGVRDIVTAGGCISVRLSLP
jgi:cysteine-rich repeat protein